MSLLSACSPELTPADAFRIDLSEYCGKAFAGKLVSNDEVDAGFASEDIVMHVRDCSENEARIPIACWAKPLAHLDHHSNKRRRSELEA